MIGVGVVGAGAAALTAHLPSILASGRFRLVGVCDSSASRLAEALQRFPAPGFATSEALLAAPGLDAVVVATPPQTHVDIVAAALRNGKHVLCEKPLARTVHECRVLIAAASEASLTLAVAHEKRFNPSLRMIRDVIARGELGTLFYGGVHWASAAKLEPDRLIPEGFRHGYDWRWRDPDVGGGIVQDHLPHYLDLMRFWTDQEPVSVQAHVLNTARGLLGWQPEDSMWEDFGLAVVRFSEGFVFRFETSVVGRSISPIWSLGSGLGEWTEYGYLLGTKGQLVFDLMPWDSTENGRVAINRRAGEGWIGLDQPEPERRWGGAAMSMFRGQIEAWADAIEGRTSQIATGFDGLICIAAVEAAYRAAADPVAVAL